MATRTSSVRWLVSLVVACTWCPASYSSRAVQGTQQAATPIALHEAEILIYLLPQAQEVRNQGWEIGWELQTSAEVSGSDSFVFYVYNATRPSGGSVTIGYFAVDKHTADIWEDDVPPKLVASREIEAVQKILRRAHHIDDAFLKKYRPRGSPFGSGTAGPSFEAPAARSQTYLVPSVLTGFVLPAGFTSSRRMCSGGAGW